MNHRTSISIPKSDVEERKIADERWHVIKSHLLDALNDARPDPTPTVAVHAYRADYQLETSSKPSPLFRRPNDGVIVYGLRVRLARLLQNYNTIQPVDAEESHTKMGSGLQGLQSS